MPCFEAIFFAPFDLVWACDRTHFLYLTFDLTEGFISGRQGMTNAIANDSFANALSIVVRERERARSLPAIDPFFRSIVHLLILFFLNALYDGAA